MGSYFLEDLSVGMEDHYGRTVTEADIVMFSGISGDTNPVHLNEDYAKGTLFKTRIAHGMLSAGFISAVLGTRMPGPGTIYLSQNLNFLAPVKIGDTVVAKVKVDKIIAEKSRVILLTQCFIKDKMIIDGQATVMVPKRS